MTNLGIKGKFEDYKIGRKRPILKNKRKDIESVFQLQNWSQTQDLLSICDQFIIVNVTKYKKIAVAKSVAKFKICN